MRNFRNLLIWQKSMGIAADVYFFAASLPTEEKFGIRSQVTRAAVSMASNIAEGCSRKSDKELAHFLEIALGSSFELETQLLICKTIKIGDPLIDDEIVLNLSSFQKMLNVFYSKVSMNASKS
ncbi:MAG: four helix bundle protein [Bacteroidetes bacterium]|nr:four helix bundle protein [Bacteroidota bacterium]MCL6103885.1 four helix bundle protein [Bacteroidota bacterium]